MGTEINLVKEAANEIMDVILSKGCSQINDVNLVTFNDDSYHYSYFDPSTKIVLKESKELSKVKRTLADLAVQGGGDCEEYSISGIEMGLIESKQNSYMIVFTDAPPKDGHVKIGSDTWYLDQTKLNQKVAGVNKQAQYKGNPIFFFLTKHPGDYCKEERYNVYWDIAAATNGKWTTVPFTVDDQTEYVIVSATAAGFSDSNKVELSLEKKTTLLNVTRPTWTKNNKVLRINNPAPGNYNAIVKGSKETTVMIFARTDFDFQHGFSENVPATFRNDKLQPTDGIKSFLLIKVNDPTQSVNIKTVQIVQADNGNILYTFPLTKQSKNYYSTESFVPPPPHTRFLIEVIGEGKTTHKEIKRTAKTPIQSRPQNIDPVISIQGGGIYPYNSDVLLTCNVKASPEPRIIWKDDKDNTLQSMPKQKLNTYNYVSKINIKKLIRNSVYYCQAQAGLNGNSERIDLHVMSPFEVQEDPAQVSVIAEFKSLTVLTCNIKSKFSMKIQWYHVLGNTEKLLGNSDSYKISNDGTHMTVNRVKQENEGRYYCVARLNNDQQTMYRLERQIVIKHVAPVMGPSHKIVVYENTPIHLNCSVVKAYPKPIVTWMFKGTDAEKDVFRTLHEGDFLQINSASLSSEGVYKCTATNHKGSNSHEIFVTVLKKPTISKIFVNNEEKDEVIIEYNSTVDLVCQVISHPPPTVVWKNEIKEILDPVRVVPKHNELTSYLKISPMKKSDEFACEASNILGADIKRVRVTVQSPFQISSPATVPTEVKYGDNATIHCGVTSKFPVKIIWMKETGELITESGKYSMISKGNILQISNATLDTNGRYICKAFIADDELTNVSRETFVTVVAETPKLEKQLGVTVLRDETAVIKCHVTKGFPKPKVTWMVKNEKMIKFKDMKEEGEELTVPSAQYQDAGSYKCVARNEIGTDEQTVQLVVEGPSKILSDADKLYSALVGDVTLRIPCVTEGFPKPVISWTIEDKTLPADKFYVDVDDTLVIKNPEEEDGGYYKCKAVNKHGTDEKYFEVEVMEYVDYDRDDDIVGSTTYVDILEGSTKQLDCASKSSKGRWYKSKNQPTPVTGVEASTEAVTESYITKRSQKGYPLNLRGTLTIQNATSAQDGSYTCRLSDNTGSKSQTYIVAVGNPPVFLNPSDEEINEWQGSKISLSCEVFDTMYPKTRTAKAEWMYNGKPSYLATEEIAQSIHPIVSWGQYTCTISNVHGKVTKNFNVHSTGCLMPVNTTVNRSPLVLDTSGTWPKFPVTFRHKYLYMPHNHAVLLSCRSKATLNYFENLPKTFEIEAKCDHEDNFLVNEKIYKLSDLHCGSDLVHTIQATGQKCFYEHSEVYNVGFNVVLPEPHFLNVYTVCFDKSKNVPIYSKVNVTLSNQIELDIEKTSWEKFGRYNEKNEEFCKEGSKCCLKQSQLVGQLEVANGPAQSSTFIKGLNTVPYWTGCNNTDDSLEKFNEWMRHKLSDHYKLMSGAFNYVETNGTMVPRYLWKVLRQESTLLIYVHVNDPHPTVEDVRCKDHGCPKSIPKGPYSYCCEPAEFQKAFDFDVSDI
ncbi:immunoglobulin i-set domain-containing protein [Phthorimaea operculella]|nr:immunoglobulin i-set domain-containing protein [Phthorimaea operculella]